MRKDIIKKPSATKRELGTGRGEINFLKVTRSSNSQARASGGSVKLKWPRKDLRSRAKKANRHGDDREPSNNVGIEQNKR